jgi:hypothetical protein
MKWAHLVSRLRSSVFSLTALAPMAPLAFGQTSTTGGILGSVTDPTGAVITNGTVTVKSQGTDAVRTVMTDKDGQFTVGLLPPGLYTVTIAAPGFEMENPGDQCCSHRDGSRGREAGVGKPDGDSGGLDCFAPVAVGECEPRDGGRWNDHS